MKIETKHDLGEIWWSARTARRRSEAFVIVDGKKYVSTEEIRVPDVRKARIHSLGVYQDREGEASTPYYNMAYWDGKAFSAGFGTGAHDEDFEDGEHRRWFPTQEEALSAATARAEKENEKENSTK